MTAKIGPRSAAAAVLLLSLVVRCGGVGPEPTNVDRELEPAGKGAGDETGPRATDPVPPGWPGGGVLSHDGLPSGMTFEGVGLVCLSIVAEQYAAQGVHFTGAPEALVAPLPCLNTFAYPPHSPVTVIYDAANGTFGIDFDFTTNDVGARYNAFLPLTMTCTTGPGGTGGVVGTAVAVVPNLDHLPGAVAPPNSLVRVQGAGIRSCTFTGSPGFFTIDDVFCAGCPGGSVSGPGTCEGLPTSPGVQRVTFGGVTTFVGTDGPDVIGGTNGIDVVLGRGEDDSVCTYGGIDTIDGGGGDDRVFGGNQNDVLFGRQGGDHLEGGNANDRIDGGHTPVPSQSPDADPDTCVGGAGNDRFYLCETILDGAAN